MVGQPGIEERDDRTRRALLLLAASLPLSAGAAALVLTRHRILAGVAAAGAATALLAARSVRSEHPGARLAFGDGVLDRLFDACVLVPLAWTSRSGSNVDAVLALVCLGASYLASYERARGEALGYAGSEGTGYRFTRYAILVLGLLTGWLLAALWAYAALTVAAAGVRAWNIALQERTDAGHGRSTP
ncbi:MAG: hypothetical protein E6G44_02935 [Actinobacteria bacterium]|nr:MAG: hypothetical protein E6G44_02935 [Actinomycetota bacterium]